MKLNSRNLTIISIIIRISNCSKNCKENKENDLSEYLNL